MVVVVPISPAEVGDLAAAVVVVGMAVVGTADGVRLRMDGKHFCRFRSSLTTYPFLFHSSPKFQLNLVPSLLFVPPESMHNYCKSSQIKMYMRPF